MGRLGLSLGSLRTSFGRLSPPSGVSTSRAPQWSPQAATSKIELAGRPGAQREALGYLGPPKVSENLEIVCVTVIVAVLRHTARNNLRPAPQHTITLKGEPRALKRHTTEAPPMMRGRPRPFHHWGGGLGVPLMRPSATNRHRQAPPTPMMRGPWEGRRVDLAGHCPRLARQAGASTRRFCRQKHRPRTQT